MDARPLALLGATLLPLASATSQTPLGLERIERPWPEQAGYGGGIDLDLACGAFVANSDSQSAAIVRHGGLFLSYSPATMEHFAAAGATGTVAIATVPAIDTSATPIPTAWQGVDRLAAIDPAGLRLLTFEDGFVQPTGAGWGPIASWQGAVDVKAALVGEGALRGRYVLGRAPGWVRVGLIDAATGFASVRTLEVTGSTQVLDAALVDWVPGGAPEFVVLLTTGSFVYDLAGNVLVSRSVPVVDGRLVAWRHNGAPAVTFVTPLGANWNVNTWQPSASGAFWLPGGPLSLPSAPTGLAIASLDGDDFPDLVISTAASQREVLLGSASGPQSSTRVVVPDVESLPSFPPQNVAPAVVADVDADGAPDLVIASSAGDRLVMLTQQPFVVYVSSPPPSANKLTMHAPRGWFQESWNLSPTPESSTQDLLGLRMELPTAWKWATMQSTQLRAVLYPISGGGQAIATAFAHYSYDLVGPDPMVDFLIPLPEWPLFSTSPQRYLIELFLTNGAGISSAKTLIDAIVKRDATLAQVSGLLPPAANIESNWYFTAASMSELNPWNGNANAGGGPAVHPPNRFFGLLPVVKVKKTIGAPSVPPPTPISGGVTHSNQ